MIKLLLTSCCIAALSATPTAQASEPSKAPTSGVSQDMRAFGQLFSCYNALKNAVIYDTTTSMLIQKLINHTISVEALRILRVELESRRKDLIQAVEKLTPPFIDTTLSTFWKIADPAKESNETNTIVIGSYMESLRAMGIAPAGGVTLSQAVTAAQHFIDKKISSVDKKLREAGSSSKELPSKE
jgi:hypothetical protein